MSQIFLKMSLMLFLSCRNLDGTGRAHTVHTFNVDIRASLASDIGAEDTGSNKVWWKLHLDSYVIYGTICR